MLSRVRSLRLLAVAVVAVLVGACTTDSSDTGVNISFVSKANFTSSQLRLLRLTVTDQATATVLARQRYEGAALSGIARTCTAADAAVVSCTAGADTVFEIPSFPLPTGPGRRFEVVLMVDSDTDPLNRSQVDLYSGSTTTDILEAESVVGINTTVAPLVQLSGRVCAPAGCAITRDYAALFVTDVDTNFTYPVFNAYCTSPSTDTNPDCTGGETNDSGQWAILVPDARTYQIRAVLNGIANVAAPVDGFVPGNLLYSEAARYNATPVSANVSGPTAAPDIVPSSQPARGALTGTVTQTQGGTSAGLQNVTVRLANVNFDPAVDLPSKVVFDPVVASATTNASGVYTLSPTPQVPAGSLSVQAIFNPTGASQSALASISAGATSTLNFTFSGESEDPVVAWPTVLDAGDLFGGAGTPVTITDADLDGDPMVAESVSATVNNQRTGEVETVSFDETGIATGVFALSSLGTTASEAAGTNNDGVLNVASGDSIVLSFTDNLSLNGTSGTTITRTATVNPGAATRLVYGTAPPANIQAVQSFTVTVEVQDALGNLVTSDNSTIVNVTVASGVALPIDVTASATAAAGVASFILRFDSAGTTTIDFSDSLAALDSAAVTGTAISIDPIPTHDLSVSVTGLAGTGLTLTNSSNGDTLSPASDGTVPFPMQVAENAAYNVTVTAQPTGPSQACSVSGGSGTMPVGGGATINVTCSTNSFSVGGTLSGLAGGTQVVLQNNGGDDLALSVNGTYNFPTTLADLSAYNVTVLTQPSGPAQTCVISNGSGTLNGGNIANADVTCTNSAPSATNPGPQAVNEGGFVDFTLTGADVDGGVLTVDLTAGPSVGTLTDTGGGMISFPVAAPVIVRYNLPNNPGSAGPDSIDFTVTDDGSNVSITETVTINFNLTDDAPVATTVGSVTVAEDGTVTLPNTQILATDPDTATTSLTWSISGGPSVGQVELASAPGTPIASFTQADVDANRVVYVHGGDEVASSDSFDLQVSDGTTTVPGTPATFSVTVNLADDAPVVATNAGMTINEGAWSFLGNGVLQTTDADTAPASIVYTLTALPSFGAVEYSGTPMSVGQTFTQAEIDAANVVRYQHDGSENFSDSFVFDVSDGTTTISAQSFSLTMLPQDDAPVVSTNAGLTLNEAATGTIGQLELETTDGDTATGSIIYTIQTAPVNGTLYNSVLPLAVSDMFTQADIDSNAITYQHDGSETVSDSFDFDVSDGTTPVTGQSFAITVLPVDDVPVVAINTGFAVDEGNSFVLTAGELETTDAETAVTGLTYTVTVVPVNGQIEDPAGPGIALSSFTQEDINLGNVQYVHDGSQTSVDSFDFSVSDGTNSEIGTVSITINPVDNSPVVSANTGATVVEGGSVTIGQTELEYTDVDNIASQLTYTVAAAPANGQIEYAASPGVSIGSFTQADLNGSLVVYVHDGGETTSDSFGFDLSDGTNIVSGSFSLTITPVDDAPVVATNAGMTLNEGAAAAITQALLETTDVDTAATSITYTIAAAPVNGQLELMGIPLGATDTFTQQNVNDGNVAFAHDGSETISDSFGFDVSDGTTPITAQTFSITVNSVDDAPSVATNTGLTVNEGSSFVLTASELQTTDADTATTALTYTLTSVPANGTLDLLGTPLALSGTFTQSDIDAGSVAYVHDGLETTSDGFAFDVTDGTTPIAGQTFSIAVTPVDDAPVVATNAGMTLNEGATGTIGQTELETTDVDTIASSIIYTVQTVPANGTLFLSVTPLAVSSTFTQADVNASSITYQHDGSETTSDSFTFDVSDGTTPVTAQIFNVTVTPQNDAPSLDNSGNLVLSTINEDDVAPAGDTVATILVSDGGVPDPVTDADVGALEGIAVTGADNTNGAWEYSTDGGGLWNPLSGVSDTNALLLTDIDLIRFVPNLNFNGTIDPGITFRAWDQTTGTLGSFVDTSTNGGTTAFSTQTDTAAITVTAVNDPPQISVNAGVTLDENSSIAISNAELSATDAEGDPITYNVTFAPLYGQLELAGAPGTPISSFTQTDLNSSNVVYVQDGIEVVSDSFDFDLFDGSASTTGLSFPITINIVDDAPVVVTNSPLMTTEGSSATIGSTELETQDEETLDPTMITYTVTAAPLYGQLELTSGPGTPISSFTQDGLNTGSVVYVNDGSEQTSDSFNFDVDDGLNIVSDTFSISITTTDDSPVIASNAGISVVAGTTTTVTAAELQTIDEESPATSVTYNILSGPGVGRFELASAPGISVSGFTQDDINQNQVVFAHPGAGTGTFPVDFEVSDGVNPAIPDTFVVSVNAAMAQSVALVNVPTRITKDVPISGLVAEVQDQYGNRVETAVSETLEIQLVTGSGSLQWPSGEAIAKVVENGSAWFTGVTYDTVEAIQIQAIDQASLLTASSIENISVEHSAPQPAQHSEYPELMTRDGNGQLISGDSDIVAMSGDGRFVLFLTNAPVQVSNGPAVTNGLYDLFVRDRLTNTVERASLTESGTESTASALGVTSKAGMSSDGRFVVFASDATDLVTGDLNAQTDIFVRDMVLGVTERVNLPDPSSGAAETDALSGTPAISPDGRFVAFSSMATNLLSVPTANEQVFVRDRATETTFLISEDLLLNPATGSSYLVTNSGSFTANGRQLLFCSDADNLVATDSNALIDLFVYDFDSMTIELASADGGGNPTSAGALCEGSISANGRFVAFASNSQASEFGSAANDLNGVEDIFVRDRVKGMTRLISFNASTGDTGNGASRKPRISGNGVWVGYESQANDLDPFDPDTDGLSDVYAYDGLAGFSFRVTPDSVTGSDPLVSTVAGFPVIMFGSDGPLSPDDTNGWKDGYGISGSDGGTGNGRTQLVSINDSATASGNGVSDGVVSLAGNTGLVAFESEATDLVAGDSNGFRDVFVWDAQTWKMELVSVDANGNQVTDGLSRDPAISGDGRWVAFVSTSSSWGSTDTNLGDDIYLKDRLTGDVVLVSHNASATDSANSSSDRPDISADGSWIVFDSAATDLVAGDAEGQRDVFICEVATGNIIRVSESGGVGGNGTSGSASISANGEWVVYVTRAGNLNGGSANDNVVVWERATGATTLISADGTGSPTRVAVEVPAISSDGRFVAFASDWATLVTGDGNGSPDVFVRDRDVSGNGIFDETGDVATVRVSIDSFGLEGAGTSDRPAISGDGRYVAFRSAANDLYASPVWEEVAFGASAQVSWTALAVSSTPLVPGTLVVRTNGERCVDNGAGSLVCNSSGFGTITNYATGTFDITFGNPVPDGEPIVAEYFARNGDVNAGTDVFLHDLISGQTKLMSRDEGGFQPAGSVPAAPAISPDGELVFFATTATIDGTLDVDALSDLYGAGNPLAFGVPESVESKLIAQNGMTQALANNESYDASPGLGGRTVGYVSSATNLHPDDVDGATDYFITDLQTNRTILAARDSSGANPPNPVTDGVVSEDGRYVAFVTSDGLLPTDATGPDDDVYVRDLLSGHLIMVSIAQGGLEATGNSTNPVISESGRYVAFQSSANDVLLSGDSADVDIFVYDLKNGTTEIVSVDSSGIKGSGSSTNPAISADGRFVAFTSDALLVGGVTDSNGGGDVYVRDRATGTTTLVSIADPGGATGNGTSTLPVISADGRYVAFQSNASDLVPSDGNGTTQDIFVRDMVTGLTRIASADPGDVQSAGASWHPAISAGGQYVAFAMDGDDLEPLDTNGYRDIYVKNLVTTDLALVSYNYREGLAGNRLSEIPVFAEDGKAIFFETLADTLASGSVIDRRQIIISRNPLEGPHQLFMWSAPSGFEVAGQTWSTFTVEIRDYNGAVLNGEAVCAELEVVTGTGWFSGQQWACDDDGNGYIDFTGVTYEIAESLDFRVVSGGLQPTATYNVVVDPAAPDHLSYVPGWEPALTQVAGSTWPEFRVEIRDIYENPVPLAGENILLFDIGGTGALQGTTSVATDGTGVAAFTDISHNIAETFDLDVQSSPSGWIIDLTETITVNGDFATETVVVLPGETLQAGDGGWSTTGAPTAQIAGTPFNVDVYAVDAWGNVDVFATDPVSVTTNDTLDADPAASNFVSGVATFTIDPREARADYTVTPSGGIGTLNSSTMFGVNPGPASQISLTGPTGVAAGTCSVYTITSTDAYGNPSNIGTNAFPTLSGVGSGSFYSDGACTLGNEITSTTIAAGTNSASVYYSNTTAEAVSLFVDGTAAGLGTDSLGVSVNPGAITQLALTGPTSVTAGSCNAYTVETRDSFGNPSPVGGDTSVDLTGLNGGSYHGDAGCTLATPITIASGTSSIVTYYTNTLATTVNLLASENPDQGWTDGMLAVTITADPTPFQLALSPLSTPNFVEAKTPWSFVVVEVQDQYGNVIDTDNSTQVTIALNSGSGSLSGTLLRTAENGIAVFDDLSYDRVESIIDLVIDDNAGPLTSTVTPGVTVMPALPPDLPTERVSVASSGALGPNSSTALDVSHTGRFTVFSANADGLVPDDSNGVQDVYVHDRYTGGTELVSRQDVGSGGTPGNAQSINATISADGRFVAFASLATNLNASDVNDDWDAFVYDRRDDRLILVSGRPDGTVSNSAGANGGVSGTPMISADGRFVAFAADYADLVGTDSNGAVVDVFVHDLATKTTRLISVDDLGNQFGSPASTPAISAHGDYIAFTASSSIWVREPSLGTSERADLDSGGAPATPGASQPSLSADGRLVVFRSIATDLIASDTNGAEDVFVRDRVGGTTRRVSVDSAGAEHNGTTTWQPRISPDGRFISFRSDAANLDAANDGNADADVYLHDLLTGETTVAAIAESGAFPSATFTSNGGMFSGDGGYILIDSTSDYVTSIVGGGAFTSPNPALRPFDGAGGVERISVDSVGAEGDTTSGSLAGNASVSANGRFVAFESDATNLALGDNNAATDVFVRDRASNRTTRISVASDGAEGNGGSVLPDISADGRYVVFASSATNLAGSDSNGAGDVFVHDLITGETTMVSVDSGGVQGNALSGDPAISADGRLIAFESSASNLVAGDINGNVDIFVHDRQSGITERVSVDSGGAEGAGNSGDVLAAGNVAISADGRFVAFDSLAQFVAGDVDAVRDVYLRDRLMGTTEIVSVDSGGAHSNVIAEHPDISADGSLVVFESDDGLIDAGNGFRDVYLRDLGALQTIRVSVGPGGIEPNEKSHEARISEDGRFVAFHTNATNLVFGGTTSGTYAPYAIVVDRISGAGVHLDLTPSRLEAQGASDFVAISGDGKFITFHSDAADLVPGDTNAAQDVFVAANPLLRGFSPAPGTPFTAADGMGNATPPSPIASGDFDGNGIPDLVYEYEDGAGAFGIRVSLTDGQGALMSGGYESPVDTNDLAVGDINGDGHLDVVLTTAGDNITFWPGDGTGQLNVAAGQTFPVIGVSQIQVGHVDGDGLLDVVVGSPSGTNVTMLRHTGPGGSLATNIYDTGQSCAALATGDFNLDGWLDVACSDGAQNMAVRFGDGAGTFPAAATGSPFLTTIGPDEIGVGDVNADGVPDLILAGDSAVQVWLGDGIDSFANFQTFSTNISGPASLRVFDVDRDGDDDVVLINTGWPDIRVLLSDGAGNLSEAPYSPMKSGSAPGKSTAADFNGDGAIDIALVDATDDELRVLLNEVAPKGGLAEVVAGADFTCSRDVEGQVGCWGGNTYGQLGDGTTFSSYSPVGVLLSKPAKKITAGDYFACALLVDGSVECWGNNGDGQLGDGAVDFVVGQGVTTGSVYVYQGDGTGGFAQTDSISVGNNQALVLSGDLNNDGFPDVVTANQGDGAVRALLGNGNGTLSASVLVDTLSSARGIALAELDGDTFLDLVAVDYTNDLVNVYQGVGDGTFTAARWSGAAGDGPEAVTVGDIDNDGDPDIVTCSSLDDTYTVIRNDGTYIFTGSASVAGVGANVADCDLEDLTADGNLDLVVTSGSIWVLPGAGDGTFGVGASYAAGTQNVASVTGDVNGDTAADVVVTDITGNLVYVLAGNGTGALSTASTVTANSGSKPTLFDYDADGDLDIIVGERSANNILVYRNAGSGTFSLASSYPVNNPTSFAVGDFAPSVIGTYSATPVRVAGISNATDVAAGANHACMATAQGRGICWGRGTSGQIGNDTLASTDLPAVVLEMAMPKDPLNGVVAVAAGVSHSCASLANGFVRCWGNDGLGQLGRGVGIQNDRVAGAIVVNTGNGVGFDFVVGITAGTDHTCFRNTKDEVKCWGDNTTGQLGDNSGTQQDAPVSTTALGSPIITIEEIAAGDDHTCAVESDGKAWCWGANVNGQLGNGTTTNALEALSVQGLPLGGASLLGLGGLHSCAVVSDGGLYCWGDNTDGKLGTGTTQSRVYPGRIFPPSGS